MSNNELTREQELYEGEMLFCEVGEELSFEEWQAERDYKKQLEDLPR